MYSQGVTQFVYTIYMGEIEEDTYRSHVNSGNNVPNSLFQKYRTKPNLLNINFNNFFMNLQGLCESGCEILNLKFYRDML